MREAGRPAETDGPVRFLGQFCQVCSGVTGRATTISGGARRLRARMATLVGACRRAIIDADRRLSRRWMQPMAIRIGVPAPLQFRTLTAD